MLVTIDIDENNSVTVDHSNVQIFKEYRLYKKENIWAVGVYVVDHVNKNEDDVLNGNTVTGYVSQRTLIRSHKFTNNTDANKCIDDWKSKINKLIQPSSSSSTLLNSQQMLDIGQSQTVTLTEMLKSIQDLVELSKPKPRASRKKKEDI